MRFFGIFLKILTVSIIYVKILAKFVINGVKRMIKDTSEMLKELEACSNFEEFLEENNATMVKKALSESLEELLKKHNIKKSEAVKRSEINEIYAYQIFAGSRIPERAKLLCIAIGLGLTLQEVQNLLKTSGYAPLYVKIPFDCIIAFGIHKKLSLMKINSLLYENELETLG